MIRDFASPGGFRMHLEEHLNRAARASGQDSNVLRKKFVFERVLARIAEARLPWIVKGAMALEIRFPRLQRRTRDLDLGVPDALSLATVDVRDRILDVLAVPGQDFFEFRVSPGEVLGPAEGGRECRRFRLEAWLAKRRFDNSHIDLSLGDPAVLPPDDVRWASFLAADGFPSVPVRLISREQHFAEKVHALVRSYAGRPSSRVKDLVDLMILIGEGLPDVGRVRKAVEAVFALRGSAPVPREIPDPPAEWAGPYAGFARELRVPEDSTSSAAERLRAFWSVMISP